MHYNLHMVQVGHIPWSIDETIHEVDIGGNMVAALRVAFRVRIAPLISSSKEHRILCQIQISRTYIMIIRK